MVDFYAGLADNDQASRAQSAIANDLANAYAGNDESARLSAIRSLWGSGERTPYGRLILTARVAARLPVIWDRDEADQLVASMLSAGTDRSAARWAGAVKPASDGWAMITLADPDHQDSVGYDVITNYAGSGDVKLKQRLFFAGMAGLGRLSRTDIERGAEALDVRIGQRNARPRPWTRRWPMAGPAWSSCSARWGCRPARGAACRPGRSIASSRRYARSDWMRRPG